VFPAGETIGGGKGGSNRADIDTQQRIESWVKLVEQGAPREQIERAELELAQALRANAFQVRQALPFFQRIVQTLKGAQAYQQFRLSNGQVVVDKRDKAAESAKGNEAKAAEEVIRSRKNEEKNEVKEGKDLLKGKDSASRADSLRDVSRGGLENRAAASRVDKLLSAFERMVVERFEGGREIASQGKAGEPTFLTKTEAQWKAFFEQFMHRTVRKSIDAAEIKNFLLRGVIGKGDKGIFIGDMRLKGGGTEKFVRFSILAEIFAKLRGARPGITISGSEVGDMTGEELMYLALAASKRKEYEYVQKAADGKFMGGKAEERAAKELGLTLDSQLKEKAKKLRERGRKFGFGMMFDRDPEPEDIPYRFVPWWHWGNISRPGKFKWFTVFFYSSLFALALIGVVLASMKLLKG